MIDIKGAAGLARRAISRIVIAITNCCRFKGGQGLLFMYRDIYPQAKRLVTPCVLEAIVSNSVLQYQPTCCYRSHSMKHPTLHNCIRQPIKTQLTSRMKNPDDGETE